MYPSIGTNTKVAIQLVFVAFATMYIYMAWALKQTFKQNGYTLINDHMTVEVKNKAYVNIRVANNMFNRTTRTFSLWITYVKEPNPSYNPVVLQAYRFSDNVYKLFAAINIKANICDIIAKNTFGFGAIKEKNGNYTDCPWKKNVVYHIHDFVPDESKLPPLIPEGKYRIALKFYNDKDYFADISWYGSFVKRKQF